MDGSITAPMGFSAAGVAAGIKRGGQLDLGLLYSQVRCAAAAVYTTNQLKGASLLVTMEHLRDGHAQAAVVNSGNANACTGERGTLDAREMARTVGRLLRIPSHDVVVASTGLIGEFLPLPKTRKGIENAVAELDQEGGSRMARAIMTTDTRPKNAAYHVTAAGRSFTLGGIAKGAGMIHPKMATMLAFLSTDARSAPDALRRMLADAVGRSFNRITVDRDTSCDDMVVLFANGLAMGDEITVGSELGNAFEEALLAICKDLAKQLVQDGEGVTKVATITCRGARDELEATKVAETIATSLLVKTAIFGGDPNWGRIVNAAGYSGVPFDISKIELWIGAIKVFADGMRTKYIDSDVAGIFRQKEIQIVLDLHRGPAQAEYLTSDLSQEYVRINSDYSHRT
jgi:glutamate N-acetyltransferase/amino-acid N-acetyltransferase